MSSSTSAPCSKKHDASVLDEASLERYHVCVDGVDRLFLRTTVADMGFVPPEGKSCYLNDLWDHVVTTGGELCPLGALQALSEKLPKRRTAIVAMRLPGHEVMMAGRRAFHSYGLPETTPGPLPSAEIIYLLPAPS